MRVGVLVLPFFIFVSNVLFQIACARARARVCVCVCVRCRTLSLVETHLIVLLK